MIRELDESAVLEHALLAAQDGHPVPLEAFLTADEIAALTAALAQDPAAPVEQLVARLPDSIQANHVRLYRLRHGAVPAK
jgi:hypothetical protein